MTNADRLLTSELGGAIGLMIPLGLASLMPGTRSRVPPDRQREPLRNADEETRATLVDAARFGH